MPDTRVYLEVGPHRVFACALDWPGWCRSGKTEATALEALAAYAPRYAIAADEAHVSFPGETGDSLDVVERLPGTATTDYGAPGEIASVDTEPLTSQEAARLAALVGASWTVFDRVAGTAPAELRKGPRGGGRNRDAIVEHILGAEVAYASKLGHRQPQPAASDVASIAVLRAAILDILRASRGGPAAVERGWPARYAARRIAWHVLDHAWEIEDRSEPASR